MSNDIWDISGEKNPPVDFQFVINMITETKALKYKFHEETELCLSYSSICLGHAR